MTKQHLSITVIIPTLARSKSVRRLLDSVAKQTRLPEQIVIVDASEDHDTEAVVSQADAVLQDRLEYYRTERGLTLQRNFGLQKANSDIIGFFDDDVVLDEAYLEEIAKPFASDTQQSIGGATGYVYPTELKGSRLHKAYVNLITYLYGSPCLATYYNLKLIPETPFTETIAVRYTSGCNMFFRREVFDAVQFDEWFEGYGLGEDKDFSLRVARDWKILAVGAARLEHLHESAGRPNYRKLAKMCIENHTRILFVARDDHLTRNALALITRQMMGITVISISYLLIGRFRDAVNFFFGGLLGIPSALQHLLRKV